MSPSSVPLIIPIVALLVPIVIVPVALIMKHLTRSRERQHAERMRAIELGHPLPETNFWPALAALGLGFGVPLMAGVIALATTAILTRSQDSYSLNVYDHLMGSAWFFAGLIGGAGVLGGTVLGSILLITRRRSATAPPGNGFHKPRFDPEVLDPAGHR